jgi:hypothetical protein
MAATPHGLAASPGQYSAQARDARQADGRASVRSDEHERAEMSDRLAAFVVGLLLIGLAFAMMGNFSLHKPNPHWYEPGVGRTILSLFAGDDNPASRVVLVVEQIIFRGDANWSDKDDAIVTMAGYAAMFPAWVDFEVQSRAMLKGNGIDVFHSYEFFATKDDYKGWTRNHKEGFARNWQKIAQGKLDLGITFGVRKSKFEEAKAQHHVAQSESAFGYCFRQILGYLVADPIMEEMWKRGATLSVVLERGDANAGDAQRVFNQYAVHSPRYARIFNSFGFVDKRQSPGLQFADFLAVTSRKYAERYSPETGYAEESGIISALRDGVWLIDLVAEEFQPVVSGAPVS